MSGMSYLVAPTIIFLIFVAPLWLTLHYRSKNKAAKGLSMEEKEVMEDLHKTVEHLEGRIHSLEKILDTEHQGWRDRHQ